MNIEEITTKANEEKQICKQFLQKWGMPQEIHLERTAKNIDLVELLWLFKKELDGNPVM